MNKEVLEKTLQDFLAQLTAILEEIRDTEVSQSEQGTLPLESSLEKLPVFFDAVRPLFGGRLTASQVSGMEAKLKAFQKAGYSVSHAAYAMATSYHETAQRMQPVREGLTASDAWRKKNLRYYPYYGRGDVQLTWLANYQKADKELGLNGALVNNLDLALDPDISARIMVKGMAEGWFTGKSLSTYLPNRIGTLAQFKAARRIINGTDKADKIAKEAMIFQEALQKAGY